MVLATQYHSGTISSNETWNKLDGNGNLDTHYITGNVVVDFRATLTIEAGALVIFDYVAAVPPGSSTTYGIRVKGKIYAVGTSSDYITFTPKNTTSGNGWKGIQFVDTNTVLTSELKYCIMEYAWKPSSVSLTVTNCGAALYIKNRNTVIVEYCKIRNCSAYRGGGIFIYECSPTIRLNQIYNNAATEGAGIYIYQNNGSFTLLNNLIFKNTAENDGGGVYCNNTNLTLNYCTVADNIANNSGSSYDGGGIYLNGGSSITARNSILYFNAPDQAYPIPDNTDYNYCCIENLGSPSYGNINGDPKFVNRSMDNYRISDNQLSPCLDVGDNSVSYTSYCVYGMPRVYNGTIDIGAHENYNENIKKSGNSLSIFGPDKIMLFPNPTNRNFTTLLLTLERKNNVKIELTSLNGNVIFEIFKGELMEGDYVYFINLENLNNGLYFIKCQISENKFSKKLIID